MTEVRCSDVQTNADADKWQPTARGGGLAGDFSPGWKMAAGNARVCRGHYPSPQAGGVGWPFREPYWCVGLRETLGEWMWRMFYPECLCDHLPLPHSQAAGALRSSRIIDLGTREHSGPLPLHTQVESAPCAWLCSLQTSGLWHFS